MGNEFLDIARAAEDLHFKYVEQFLVALVPMIFTVILHGLGMGTVTRIYNGFVPASVAGPKKGPSMGLLVLIVAIMLGTHFLEIIVWAAFFIMTGMLHDINAAMFYSMNNYSTLGASDITLAAKWKGLAGFEAMTAMLMFGWSTAMLATIVQKMHRLND